MTLRAEIPVEDAPPPASLLAEAERSSLPAQNGLDLASTGCLSLSMSAISPQKTPHASPKSPRPIPVLLCTAWLKQAWSRNAAKRRDRHGICLPPPTEPSATKRPMCASAASSHCSKSRWWFSTWRSTVASRDGRRRSYAKSPLIKRMICWLGWPSGASLPCVEPRKGRFMSGRPNIWTAPNPLQKTPNKLHTIRVMAVPAN